MRRLGARNDLSYEASKNYLMTVECHHTDTNNSVRQTTEHDSKDAAISTHSYTVDERRMVRALGAPILNQYKYGSSGLNELYPSSTANKQLPTRETRVQEIR